MAVFFWKDRSGGEVYLKFDAVSVVEFSRETEITEHPVEKGPDVSDHIRARLVRAAVTAYVSNTPLYSNEGVEKLADYEEIDLPRSEARKVNFGQPPGAQTGRDAIYRAAEATKIYGLVFSDLRSRVREAREMLTEAQEGGYLLSLTDADGDFDQLVIERMATIRALEDGNGATFQLEVRQIRLTTVEETDAPEPAEARGQAPTNQGNQSAKADKPEDGKAKQEAAKSYAASLLDGAQR